MYDEYLNKINLLTDYFPNFPSKIKGGISNKSSIVTLFSTTHLFIYDVNLKKLIENGKSISSYFKCK